MVSKVEQNVWRQLHLYPPSSSATKLPQLFYRFATSGSDGFTLILTDLEQQWKQSLTKRDVLEEASEQHVPIDPSEPSQHELLLNYIADALSKDHNQLTKDGNTSTDAAYLKLRTSIALPKPLKPLIWNFSLEPSPTTDLTHELLFPALKSIHLANAKVDSLVEQMEEKDNVVQRLLERVSSAVAGDLSVIFPTLTGMKSKTRGQISVAMAEEHVAGLKPFDAKLWEQDFANDDSRMNGMRVLADSTSKRSAPSSKAGWVGRLPDADKLENLGEFQPQRQPPSREQSKAEATTRPDGESSTGGDEFERQPTPPRSKKHVETPAPSPEESSHSDSPDALDLAIKCQSTGRKLGMIGQRKGFGLRSTSRRSSSLSDSGPTPETGRRKLVEREHTKDSDESTQTESSPERPRNDSDKAASGKNAGAAELENKVGPKQRKDGSSSPERRSPSMHPSSPARPHSSRSNESTPRRRPGRIGVARQRTATASPIAEEEKERSSPARSSTAATPSHKLGRLGMRRRDGDDSAEKSQRFTYIPGVTRAEQEEHDGTATRSRSDGARQKSAKSQDSSPPNSRYDHKGLLARNQETIEEETEAEKASRRRKELKRKINAGGGQKKKKRF